MTHITDRNADVVEARSCNLSKVVRSDPCRPVILQRGLGHSGALERAKGPLVDNVGVVGGLEERRGDPRLENEPL
jgi:hypothetical protein